MKNPFNHPAWIDISLLLGRLALGSYMLLAGWGKITGDGGVSGFVSNGFMKLSPAWLPEWFGRPYGYALPFAELILGALLVLGLFTRPAAGLICLVLISIAIALISQFGIKGAPGGGGGPFHYSLLMIPLALILMVVGSGRLALDPLYFAGAGAGGGGGKR